MSNANICRLGNQTSFLCNSSCRCKNITSYHSNFDACFQHFLNRAFDILADIISDRNQSHKSSFSFTFLNNSNNTHCSVGLCIPGFLQLIHDSIRNRFLISILVDIAEATLHNNIRSALEVFYTIRHSYGCILNSGVKRFTTFNDTLVNIYTIFNSQICDQSTVGIVRTDCFSFTTNSGVIVYSCPNSNIISDRLVDVTERFINSRITSNNICNSHLAIGQSTGFVGVNVCQIASCFNSLRILNIDMCLKHLTYI